MTDDKRKTNEGFDGRGAHTPYEITPFEEALAKNLKLRKEARERDEKLGMPTRPNPGRVRKFGRR